MPEMLNTKENILHY